MTGKKESERKGWHRKEREGKQENEDRMESHERKKGMLESKVLKNQVLR